MNKTFKEELYESLAKFYWEDTTVDDYRDPHVKASVEEITSLVERLIGEMDTEYIVVDKKGEHKPKLKYKVTDTYYNPIRNGLRESILAKLKE